MTETTIKEKPIIFSAPMVRAILAGRKTMTRRIITDRHLKRLGLERDGEYVRTFDGPQWDGTFESGTVPWCTYGSPGDRLWVRETFVCGWHDGVGGYSALRPTGPQYERPDKVFYKSDFPADDEKNGKRCWRPSIHMPRWASRITLKVEAVRVERLQDIKQPDIAAEGIDAHPTSNPGTCDEYYRQFQSLWASINGHESWAANPWVWVVSFSVVKP